MFGDVDDDWFEDDEEDFYEGTEYAGFYDGISDYDEDEDWDDYPFDDV